MIPISDMCSLCIFQCNAQFSTPKIILYALHFVSLLSRISIIIYTYFTAISGRWYLCISVCVCVAFKQFYRNNLCCTHVDSVIYETISMLIERLNTCQPCDESYISLVGVAGGVTKLVDFYIVIILVQSNRCGFKFFALFVEGEATPVYSLCMCMKSLWQYGNYLLREPIFAYFMCSKL